MTQCERIVAYIERFGSITQLEALRDLGCMRLASRISELRRKRGIAIEKTTKKVKNRYGKFCTVACYRFAEGVCYGDL